MSKTKKKETSDEKFTLVELVASSDVHYPSYNYEFIKCRFITTI